MAKGATLIAVGSGFFSSATMDDNYTALNTALDNTISRDGSTPNTMSADLDMNSNDILNAGVVDTTSVTIGGATVPVGVTITAGNQPVLPSRASVGSTTIEGTVTFFRTAGYAAVGDGGGGLYKGVVSEPSHEGKVQSADGAWWELVPEQGQINIRQFNASVNGTTDDQVAVENTLNAAVALNVPRVYFPAGTTLVGSRTRLETLSADLCLFGDGNTSIIKRKDETLTANNQEMFLFKPTSAAELNLCFRNLKFDGNARANGIAMVVSGVTGTFVVGETITGGTSAATARITKIDGTTLYITAYTSEAGGSFSDGETLTGGTSAATATGPTPAISTFEWQQNHCVMCISVGTLGLKTVVFDNCEVKDSAAGGLYVGGSSGNSVDTVQYINCRGFDRERTWADLIVSAPFNEVQVSNCAVDRFEIETNATFDSNYEHRVTINNLVTRIGFETQASGAFTASASPKLTASNLICLGFFECYDFDAVFDNFHILAEEEIRLLYGRYLFSNGKFEFGVVSGANFTTTQTTCMYMLGNGFNADKLAFHKCDFTVASATDAVVNQIYSDSNSGGATQEETEFVDCVFTSDNRSMRIGRGEFLIRGCRSNSSAYLVSQTGAITNTNNVLRIIDNYVSHASAYVYRADSSTLQVIDIWMSGNRSITFGQIVSMSTVAQITGDRGAGSTYDFKTVDDYEASAEPTSGRWIKGNRIWHTIPLTATEMGWVCTTSGTGGGTAVFKAMPSLA